MRVILREDVDRLGKRGEAVDVADGYARNFLFPKRKALRATQANIRTFEVEEKQQQRRGKKEKRLAETVAKKLENTSCTVAVPVGEEDRVFGSVTAQTIADTLRKEGYDIDKRKIILDRPIKALGVYAVPVKLHPEVAANIRVWVVKE